MPISKLFRHAWRIVVLVVGSTVVLIGLALIILPGPAFVVIPLGLAILATEFAWPRRLLRRIQEAAKKGVNRIKSRGGARN